MTETGPKGPKDWPKLEASEAHRVRALLVLALLLLVPAALTLLPAQTSLEPLAHCKAGVYREATGNLACAKSGGPSTAGLPAWWMGTPLDINRASAQTLTVVDGVGLKLSAKIVAYRQAHGAFGSVGDVQNVKGIGPKLAAKIAAVATVYPVRDQRSVPSTGNSNR